MSDALICWVERELACPKAMGEGRNSQMIRLAPRMLELGWSEDRICERFKAAYGLLDGSKDAEIWRVIRNARRYAKAGSSERSHIERVNVSRLNAIEHAASQKLGEALTLHPWSLEEARQLSWSTLPPIEQRRRFLGALFQRDEVIWSGDKFHSGKHHHAAHFQSVWDWMVSARAFPLVSHCTFRPGSYSRANENVEQRRYLVVESDSLSHDEILSLFRWLEAVRGMSLRAAVFSGKRSIHGWFEWPQKDAAELAAFFFGLRCDPATLRPSQPVRLAGARRPETGLIQELLFLRE